MDKSGRNVFAGHVRRRAVLGHAAPRGRRARGHDGASPWRSSRRPRMRIGATGPGCSCRSTPNWGRQSPWRRAAHPAVGRRGHAHRAPARRRRRQSLSRHGRDHRGHPPRDHERCDPGPMVAPGEVIEEKITLPLRWEAALDAFDAGTRAAAVPRRALPQAVRHLPARGMRPHPRGDQRSRLRVVSAGDLTFESPLRRSDVLEPALFCFICCADASDIRCH